MNRLVGGIFLLSWFVGPVLGQGQTLLQLSSTSALPGTTVPVQVGLTATGTRSAALQFDIAMSPNVAAVTPTVGDAAVSASKSLTCTGSRCLILGLNATAIPDGTVATLNVLLSSTASGIASIQLMNVRAVGADGSVIATSSQSGQITILPPVAVIVSPVAASLPAGQTQQFTASVTGGSGNTSVTWTLSPNVGTISTSGLYTAPATIATQQSVVVTATSVADPTKSASASLTLLAPVTVAVAPPTVSLPAGQTQQFTASVTGGSGNASVTWTLSPNVGTMSASGLYTAPATIAAQQSVVVTATSVADPTKSASASLTLFAPVSVAVAPAMASLSAGQTQQFTATVTGGSGNTAVTWSLNSNVGTMSTSGLYTAPATITTQQSVVVTATSVADTTKSATATITLLAYLSIWNPSATPTNIDSGVSGSVEVGLRLRSDVAGTITGVQFYKSPANVGPHTGHLWTNKGGLLGTAIFVNETASGWQQASFATPISIAANTTYVVSYFAPNGHFSVDPQFFLASGVDRPPLHALADGVNGANGVSRNNPNSKFPTFGSNASNYWVDLVFTPASPLVTQSTAGGGLSRAVRPASSLIPAEASLGPHQGQRFAVRDDSPAPGLRWSVTPPVGFITADGLYVAPYRIESEQTLTLTATNSATGKSTSALIRLLPDAISPGNVELGPGESVQLQAAFSGLSDSSARWSVEPAIGTISAGTGLYVAPRRAVAAPENVTVVAVNTTDESRVAVATITLLPKRVVPKHVYLAAGQQQQFMTNLSLASAPLSWAVTPAIGTVSGDGLYVAPRQVSTTQTITLVATSATDPDADLSAMITLLPSSVVPQAVTLAAGQTHQFSVVDEAGNPVDARWTLVPAFGSISPAGRYSAPEKVSSAMTVTIIAAPTSRPEETVSATVRLAPSTPDLANLECSDNWCTLTLSAPAPAAGIDVSISAVHLVAPSSWHISGGAIRSSFPVAVRSSGARVTATLGTSLTVEVKP